MRWLLDTKLLIDAFAGRSDSVRAITSARTASLEWIGYSSITRLEVLGFPGLNAADEIGLRNLLAQLSEAPIDDAVIERAIEIRKSVRMKIPDAVVAATALVYEANLVTRNTGDFKNILAQPCNNVACKAVSAFITA
ncbi:MAG: type II toxin-antitoxin system VapC family toxin [Verrucomicrobia bacterium]|nr:MAG: type II toxin-antitoxin system VapC family toxin [Verrucomicrobiota bacterium]